MATHLTAREIGNLIGRTKQAVLKRASKEGWSYIEERCRGGRVRLFPISGLPLEIQIQHQSATQHPVLDTKHPGPIYYGVERRKNERRKVARGEGTQDQVKMEDALTMRRIANDVYELTREVAELKKDNKDLRAELDNHQKAPGHFEASKKEGEM